MVNSRVPDRPSEVRARRIAPADRDAVAALLRQGFGLRRSRAFWQRAVDVLATRKVPDGMPQLGYLLESGGRAVGTILVIASRPRTGADPDAIRCSLSSWYVEPQYRIYAAMLAALALNHDNATHLNISPAANTLPTLAVQGYTRYCDGVFIVCPLLAWGDGAATVLAADRRPAVPFEAIEWNLLRDHAEFGCVAFWCVTAERAYPFVFRRRLAKGALPCAQLIYCRDTTDVARFSGLIGRYLAVRGCPLVVIDASGPMPGLPGIYVDGRPKYFKGPEKPRLGDLAYTEAALFGL
jgi:hypothetical protein